MVETIPALIMLGFMARSTFITNSRHKKITNILNQDCHVECDTNFGWYKPTTDHAQPKITNIHQKSLIFCTRIALAILSLVGTSPALIMLGFIALDQLSSPIYTTNIYQYSQKSTTFLYQDSLGDTKFGGNKPSSDHARIHGLLHVPLHVDLKHRLHCHDGASHHCHHDHQLLHRHHHVLP